MAGEEGRGEEGGRPRQPTPASNSHAGIPAEQQLAGLRRPEGESGSQSPPLPCPNSLLTTGSWTQRAFLSGFSIAGPGWGRVPLPLADGPIISRTFQYHLEVSNTGVRTPEQEGTQVGKARSERPVPSKLQETTHPSSCS